MKTFTTLLITLLISISTFAQQGINYKALIKDDAGNVLAGQTINFRFSIVDINSFYTPYIETQLITTDENGIAIANIGEGTPVAGNFSNISWEINNNFSLEVRIDITGGTAFVLMGTTPFEAVPYAKHALTSGDTITHLNQLIDARSDSGIDYSGSSLFLGRLAGYNDDGSNNSNASVGFKTLTVNTTGSANVAFGHSALQSNNTGNSNLAIGKSAGHWNVSGSGNIFIGLRAGGLNATSAAFSNRLYINKGASDNPLIYGEFDNDLIRINGAFEVKGGNATIGGSLIIQNASDATSTWQFTTVASDNLSMYRNGSYRGFFHHATGNYSSISDRRAKKDIIALENGTLNKVLQLNPVSYLMKEQTDTKRNLGLISQEVQDIFPTLTSYVDDQDLITLSYTELIPILIKALQEQQAIIETQNSKISSFENSFKALTKRMEQLEASDK